MPDTITPAATPDVSAASEPAESTSSIIESAIADLPDDGGDDDSIGAASDDDTDAAPVSGNPAAPQPTAEEIDELAQSLGITVNGKNRWLQRIPYSKVAQVWREQTARHNAAVQQHQTQIQAFERLIREQPQELLQRLATVNPAFGQYVKNAMPAAAAPAGGQHDMPAPDVILLDGSRTYSTEGLQRLLNWNGQQTEQRLASRLQPIERERQQREMIEAAIPRVRQQIADAETWPLFKESKQEILAALQSDPRIDLREAYQRVVLPKMSASRSKIREEVLREMGAQPHSTSVTRTAGGRNEEQAPRDSRDVILSAIAGLE